VLEPEADSDSSGQDASRDSLGVAIERDRRWSDLSIVPGAVRPGIIERGGESEGELIERV
jgi:hypothetical protein